MFDASSWNFFLYELTAATPRVLARPMPNVKPNETTFAKWLEDHPKGGHEVDANQDPATGYDAERGIKMQDQELP